MAESELILVTGASGFIASHLVQQLLEQGYRVRGTVRSLKNETKIQPLKALGGEANKNLELVEGDLLDAECWAQIIEGCTYVMHTASPFPTQNPSHEDEVIKPAVDGTLNVLRACSGRVKRVVLTSSVAAIDSGHQSPPNGKAYDETVWSNLDKSGTVYEKSKHLAEKAAWDYVKGLPEEQKFELAVINPSLVVGPLLTNVVGTSNAIICKIMNKEMPLLPKLSFNVIDVRAIAKAHIVAMKLPEAAGNRHIVCGERMLLSEMALQLEKEFKPMGYGIPTTNAPYPLMWIYGRFDKVVRDILPLIGVDAKYDDSRMRNVLEITPRPVNETLLDTGYSLIEAGHVKKTNKYKPR